MNFTVVIASSNRPSLQNTINSFREYNSEAPISIIYDYSVRQSVQTVSKNRNIGADTVLTDFIWFMDDDDIFGNRCQEVEKECVSGVDLILVPYLNQQIPPLHFLLQALAHGTSLPVGCILVRKSLFLKLKGFDENLEHSEVWDLLCRLLTNLCATPEKVKILKNQNTSNTFYWDKLLSIDSLEHSLDRTLIQRGRKEIWETTYS